MAVTKTARALQASASNTAGSTTTGSALDLTSALGGLVTAIVTNGGTGPTIGCSFIVEVSNDNSVWRAFAGGQVAGLVSSTTYTFSVLIPKEVMYIRSKFTGNTGQTVTIQAEFHEFTSL